MSSPRRGMRLGFVEPHLRRFGGIRRMIEFANRLTARGHLVTFYLPDDVEQRCTWMRCDATVKPIKEGFRDELDVVLFNSEPHWHLLDRFERARRRVFYALHYARLYGKEDTLQRLGIAIIWRFPQASFFPHWPSKINKLPSGNHP